MSEYKTYLKYSISRLGWPEIGILKDAYKTNFGKLAIYKWAINVISVVKRKDIENPCEFLSKIVDDKSRNMNLLEEMEELLQDFENYNKINTESELTNNLFELLSIAHNVELTN